VSALERSRGDTRRRGRRRWPRRLALAIVLAAVFVVGIAFGQALDDAPEPDGATTSVRTLTPLPQDPPARTVTVTVTVP
jgi:hypothetical protein